MVCSKGTILRKGYTKKSGTRVSSKCIRATSQSGKKSSLSQKRRLSRLQKEHLLARQKFGTPRCSKGEILREGYRRRSSSRSKGTWVSPICIPSKTNRPHGKQLFILEKDDLSPYGYKDVKHLSKHSRQVALSKVLKQVKPLPLFRKLNALYVVNKNQNPQLARIFKEDSKWVQTTKEYKNRPTSRKPSKKRLSKSKGISK